MHQEYDLSRARRAMPSRECLPARSLRQTSAARPFCRCGTSGATVPNAAPSRRDPPPPFWQNVFPVNARRIDPAFKIARQTNWQSPVQFAAPPKKSLFRQWKFAVPKRTGKLPQAFQIAARFRIRQCQNDPKQAEFVKFPVIFPVFQGIRSITPSLHLTFKSIDYAI
jgi:hypothetical protein